MNVKTTAVIAVIALVLTAGAAAAMPGSAPDGAADGENDPNEVPGGTPADDADVAENASADAGDAGGPAANASGHADEAREHAENASAEDGHQVPVGTRGPAVDLPAPVPDHVVEIHDAIQRYLGSDGEGSLGETISDIVANDDAANASSGSAAP